MPAFIPPRLAADPDFIAESLMPAPSFLRDISVFAAECFADESCAFIIELVRLRIVSGFVDCAAVACAKTRAGSPQIRQLDNKILIRRIQVGLICSVVGYVGQVERVCEESRTSSAPPHGVKPTGVGKFQRVARAAPLLKRGRHFERRLV